MEAAPAGRVMGTSTGKDQQSRWLIKQLLVGASLLGLGFFFGAGFKFTAQEEDCNIGPVSFARRSTEIPRLDSFDINVMVDDTDEVLKKQGWSDLTSGLTAYVPKKLSEAGLHTQATAAKSGFTKGPATLTLTFNGLEDHQLVGKEGLMSAASPDFEEVSADLFRRLGHMGLTDQALELNNEIHQELRKGFVTALVKEKIIEGGMDAAVTPATTGAFEETETAADAQTNIKFGSIILRVNVKDPTHLRDAKKKLYDALPAVLQELLGAPAAFTIKEEADPKDGTAWIYVTITDFDYKDALLSKKGNAFATDFTVALQDLERLEKLGLRPMGAPWRKLRTALDAQVMPPALPARVAEELSHRTHAEVENWSEIEAASATSMAM